MRVGAVDLGTNSTRLLVADVVGDTVDEIARRLTITKLGENVDREHALQPQAVDRVHRCLADYAAEIQRLGAERVLAIATSAVRDARNGGPFLQELETRFGLTTKLLSGEEEAALMVGGVSAGRAFSDGLVVDIGGGSTELVLVEAGGIAFSTSLQIGCVRVTERFLQSDPPQARELESCADAVRSLLPEIEASQAIGVAGTVTTLAALDLALEQYDPQRTHGHVISRQAVIQQLDRLAAMPLSERERVPAIVPGRAGVIVGGALILLEILDAYGLDQIETSERDILDGAAIAAAGLP